MNTNIEFKGTISKTVYEVVLREERQVLSIAMAVSFILTSPLWIALAGLLKSEYSVLIGILFSVGVHGFGLATMFLPQSKKFEAKSRSYHVFFDGEYLVSRRGIDNQDFFLLVSEAKALRDFGDFYKVIFPRHQFICQKNLISGGTLEEFEAFFDGKIERIEK